MKLLFFLGIASINFYFAFFVISEYGTSDVFYILFWVFVGFAVLTLEY